MRIFLVGLMGCGKSTVGRLLARELACDYLDNDELVLAGTGASLVSLAATGDSTLHDRESAHARQVSALPPPFVAGIAASVADRPDDMELLVRSGRLIYLRAQPATLAARLGTGAGRPWFDGDPRPVIERMFERRDAIFTAAADVVVDVDGLAPAAVVQAVRA